ncbi:MAG TPA: RNA 2',3'-cyclic phosphodiesterase [Phycisphaeraceae bacterium]
MDELRLFIAACCPASAAIERLLERLERLRPMVSPVAANQLHFTLRFLGQTPADRLESLAQAVDRAVEAAGVPAFELDWAGLGRFPPGSGQRLRIVFAQPADPTPLMRLAQAVSDELARLNPPIPPDPRGFTAHLTLARVKPDRRRPQRGRRVPRYQRQQAGGDARAAIERILRESEGQPMGRSRIEAVRLIASELTPAGPVYTTCHEAALRG